MSLKSNAISGFPTPPLMHFGVSKHRGTSYRAMTAATIATAKAPEAPTPLMLAAAPVGVAVAEAVWTACTPKVVPVMTCPLTVVVIVAGWGVAVVLLHPLQTPLQVE